MSPLRLVLLCENAAPAALPPGPRFRRALSSHSTANKIPKTKERNAANDHLRFLLTRSTKKTHRDTHTSECGNSCRLCSLSKTTNPTMNRTQPRFHFPNRIAPHDSHTTLPSLQSPPKRRNHQLKNETSNRQKKSQHVPPQLPPPTPRPPPRPTPTILAHLPPPIRPTPPRRPNRLVHLRTQRAPRGPARTAQRHRAGDLPGAPR
jgi:hypothetical protein